jgi:hypothetical protein
MAQIVKLKRTSVSGKIPTISNLELGELAMNTYDGRIFFEKDADGTLSIQEILTTNSHPFSITGSLYLNGAITASYINANGSGNSILVSDTLRIDENGSGLRMTNVGAFDNSSGDFRIFATQDLILATDGENGTAVTIDQTTKGANFVGAVTASYFVGDGSQLTNLPTDISIAEATTVTASYDNIDDITITHNFNTYNILVQVYDNDRNLIIPSTTSLPTLNTARVTLSSLNSGYVVVAKGGHLISGSLISENTALLNGQNGAYYLDWTNFNNIPTGIISSSAQIDSDLFDIDGLVSSSTQISNYGVFAELNGDGIISGSSQLEGFVSQSGNFVANETIIATGTNSVTSSNILALDTVNNYLGINQSNPEVTLHMTGDGAQTAQIRMEQYNDSSDAPDIRTRKARGTSASPAKNNAGDFIYRQNSERYNGSTYTTVGQFAVDANSSNADRFQLTLTVSEDGNTIDAAAAQFKIDGNDGGAITFNDAYKFPTSDGTNGQALITDGSGVLSFSDVTSYTDADTLAYINSQGVISGSSQITDLTTHKETVSGASSYVVDHNLNEQYPIVQCWNTSTSQQEQAESVTTNSVNRVTVTFAGTFTGLIIVKK